jgi:ClpP class serine protease
MKPKPTPEQMHRSACEEFRDLLAIHPDHVQAVAEGRIAPRAGWDEDEQPPDYSRRGSLGIVSIRGALAQRGGWWWDGHEAIRKRIERALADPQVGSVVLEISSPGGVVAGCWDNVQAIQAAKIRSGKKIYAYAREHAYSAAYAWAMCADEIHVPASGGVGSIGVLSILCDESKAWGEAGIKFLVVRSGERKARGMSFEGIDEQTVTAEQQRVDRLAAQFFELVAAQRKLKAAGIRALEGDTFDGAVAVQKDLADSVLSWDAFLVRAEEAGRKWKMKGTALALGLASDASEGEIERATVALVKDRNEKAAALDACADKLGEVATAHAVRTGRCTAGEVDTQRALIRKAPVDGAAALMARPEMAALPTQTIEARPPTNAGTPPMAPNAWAAFEALDQRGLASFFGSIVGNPQAVQHLAAQNPALYDRARAAFEVAS